MNAVTRQLILAAHLGDMKQLESLLKQGANPNEQDEQQRTALHWAALQGHIPVVRLLLQNGANHSIKANNAWTPLMFAESKGHNGVAHLLRHAVLFKPAEQPPVLGAGNGKFNEAMNKHVIEAAISNSTSRIDLLIKSGANPNATDETGCSALIYAARDGNLAAVRTLLAQKASLNLKDKEGKTALFYAILRAQHTVVQFLLSKGADINCTDVNGLSPLYFASMIGNTVAIDRLIEAGVDPNLPTLAGLTALHLAAIAGQIEALKVLLEKGAYLGAVAESGMTVLMAAAQEGRTDLVTFLVEEVDDIDEQDGTGDTALIYAVQDGHMKAVRVLIDAGADPMLENDDGMTAIDTATEKGYSRIKRILESVIIYPVIRNEATEATAPERTSQNKEQQVQNKPKQDEQLANTNSPLEELKALVGLTEVKANVEQLTNFLRVQQMRKEKGLAVPNQSLHMVFTGNPGTGKTTIARLIAQIYKSIGILSEGQFIETDRAGLVGGYLGQTAIKTHKVVEEALGGVLFIDEAYSLTERGMANGDSYGEEAVSTLLKLMEDHRDDLIVIVAGYTEPMQKFIRSNPGLQSRFNKFLHFDDYAPAELTEIFRHFAASGDYQLHPATELKLTNVFTALYANRDETFGNARLARNLFEKAINAHANRMVSAGALDEASLVTLYPEDIPNA